jgi:hypothetical protein
MIKGNYDEEIKIDGKDCDLILMLLGSFKTLKE